MADDTEQPVEIFVPVGTTADASIITEPREITPAQAMGLAPFQREE